MHPIPLELKMSEHERKNLEQIAKSLVAVPLNPVVQQLENLQRTNEAARVYTTKVARLVERIAHEERERAAAAAASAD